MLSRVACLPPPPHWGSGLIAPHHHPCSACVQFAFSECVWAGFPLQARDMHLGNWHLRTSHSAILCSSPCYFLDRLLYWINKGDGWRQRWQPQEVGRWHGGAVVSTIASRLWELCSSLFQGTMCWVCKFSLCMSWGFLYGALVPSPPTHPNSPSTRWG